MSEKWAAARLLACQHHPYLSRALCALRTVPHEGVKSVVVDEMWRVFFPPSILETATVEELEFHLLHHGQHRILGHHERCPKDPVGRKLFSLASCMAVNSMLEADGVRLPTGALSPRMLGFADLLTTDEYLDLLTQLQEQGGESTLNGLDEDGDGADLVGGLLPNDEAAPTKLESDLLVTETAEDMLRHGERENPGTMGAHWMRWATDLLNPQVDWRRQFRGNFQRALQELAGAEDYTYRRPSRRQGSVTGIILPALRAPVVNVAAIVDTSASMDPHQLNYCLGEIGGMLRASRDRMKLTVLSCDDSVNTCKRIFRTSQVVLEGGGGTNMMNGLRRAADLRPKPDLYVVLTDGITTWGKQPPAPGKYIVCLIEPAKAGPKWATNIRVQGAQPKRRR